MKDRDSEFNNRNFSRRKFLIGVAGLIIAGCEPTARKITETLDSSGTLPNPNVKVSPVPQNTENNQKEATSTQLNPTEAVDANGCRVSSAEQQLFDIGLSDPNIRTLPVLSQEAFNEQIIPGNQGISEQDFKTQIRSEVFAFTVGNLAHISKNEPTIGRVVIPGFLNVSEVMDAVKKDPDVFSIPQVEAFERGMEMKTEGINTLTLAMHTNPNGYDMAIWKDPTIGERDDGSAKINGSLMVMRGYQSGGGSVQGLFEIPLQRSGNNQADIAIVDGCSPFIVRAEGNKVNGIMDQNLNWTTSGGDIDSEKAALVWKLNPNSDLERWAVSGGSVVEMTSKGWVEARLPSGVERVDSLKTVAGNLFTVQKQKDNTEMVNSRFSTRSNEWVKDEFVKELANCPVIVDVESNLKGPALIKGEKVDLDFPEISMNVTFAIDKETTERGREARFLPINGFELNKDFYNGEIDPVRQIVTDHMFVMYKAWQFAENKKYYGEREGISFNDYLQKVSNGEDVGFSVWAREERDDFNTTKEIHFDLVKNKVIHILAQDSDPVYDEKYFLFQSPKNSDALLIYSDSNVSQQDSGDVDEVKYSAYLSTLWTLKNLAGSKLLQTQPISSGTPQLAKENIFLGDNIFHDLMKQLDFVNASNFNIHDYHNFVPLFGISKGF